MTVPYDDNEMAQYLVSQRQQRLTTWSALIGRISAMDALVNDRWVTVFPDDSFDNELPMVANQFKTHTEDVGHLFAAQWPKIVVDPDSGFQRALGRAELRERVLNGYLGYSDLQAAKELFGMDLPAAGFTAIRVWPNMKAPISERFPVYERLDPRMVWPEPRWRPDKPSDNVMTSHREPVAKLEREFPEQVAVLMEQITAKMNDYNSVAVNYGYQDKVRSLPKELEVIDYYSCEYMARAAIYDLGTLAAAAVPGGKPLNAGTLGVTLLTIDNPTGLCPVQLAARSAWSMEPQGLLDSAKGIVQTKNRFWRILLDYWLELVYGGLLVWNVQNPTRKGPGTRYLAMGPDAFMNPVAPSAPSIHAEQFLAMLENEAANTAMAPPSRRGEVDLNKASAAFLSKASGQLVDLVRSIQSNFATALQRANEFAFAADETWCNAPKTITSRARGRRWKTPYIPKRDIAGDYANTVTYGALGGLDQVTMNVVGLQQVGEGIVSKRTFREHSIFVDDLVAEEDRFIEQSLDEAFLARLQADPNIPFQVVARIRSMAENGRGLGEIAGEAYAMLAQAQQAQQAAAAGALGGAPGGGPPVGVMTGRGLGPREPLGVPAGPPGVPAEGAAGPPAGLPPLAQVRALGRRK